MVFLPNCTELKELEKQMRAWTYRLGLSPVYRVHVCQMKHSYWSSQRVDLTYGMHFANRLHHELKIYPLLQLQEQGSAISSPVLKFRSVLKSWLCG